ncbi:hypothetical protein F5B21DRAFT_249694 [Xylaria acuta]|nr:hypothetical protein F5B21DRAFT_249694 [Xylaria acuta]
MRPNAAISGLLACSIRISAAGTTERLALRQDVGMTVPKQNSIITVTQTYPPLSPQPVIPQAGGLTLWFDTHGAEISTVRLKLFNTTGPSNGDGDQPIANTVFHPSVSTSDADGKVMLNSDDGRTGPSFTKHGLLKSGLNNSVIIAWDKNDRTISDQPLYLECEWTRSTSAGNSTTQPFAFYENDPSLAARRLEAIGAGSLGDPARQETSTVTPTSPTASTSPEVATSPASGTPSQPTTTADAGAQSASSSTQQGLNKNGIIGVAVGVTVGGLLVAGTLLWLFCFRRRRRRTAAHHAMPSYASDVGGMHAMMQDKEIHVVLESSSSPRSAYGGGGSGGDSGGGGGGGGDEGRASTDQYAPYSDRSTTSPTPDHHHHHHHHHHRKTASGASTAAAVAAAAEVGGAGAGASAGATSQTDPSWTRGSAPTPTPVIMSRYAHLVEEGMTDDEIRRLEEEERQLDAAIEHAGRR